MERQQQQHWAKQAQPPLAARSRQQGQPAKATFSLSKPGCALSLLLLGSAWVVVMIIAVTAVSGLLSLNASNGHRTPGAAAMRETAETAPANSPARLPLWLFGAIALSCAAGSMLISKQANRPPRLRKSSAKVKRLTSRPAAVEPQPILQSISPQPTPQPAPQPMRQPIPQPTPVPAMAPVQPPPRHPAPVPSFVLHRQQPSAATDASPPETSAPEISTPETSTPGAASGKPFAAPITLMQLAYQAVQPSEPATNVPVTVVPPDAKHPLDWGKASLADQLDIRKRRSISSLL